MRVTARPALANGLLLRLTSLAPVVGKGNSGPRNLVEYLMVRNTRALGLQNCKNVRMYSSLLDRKLLTHDKPTPEAGVVRSSQIYGFGT